MKKRPVWQTIGLLAAAALAPVLPAQAQADWSIWNDLVGGVSPGRPAVARNADGRLEVFVRGADGALWHIWQGGPNHGLSNWQSLGGVITSNPAVARNADGRLEVFARGTDKQLYHIWQVAPNSSWSGWEGLGGILEGDPAVASNADGRLEVFVRGTDRSLHHIWQTSLNGTWSGWGSLGGAIASDPQVEQNQDGRLAVFARGWSVNEVGPLHTIRQSSPNAAWSGWSNLGGAFVGNPAVGRNADGRLEVFERGADNHLYHQWQLNPGDTKWSGPQPLRGDLHPLYGDPKVNINRGGGLEVFVVAWDGALWHRWQTRASSSDAWQPWQTMGGGDVEGLAIAKNADGRLEAFARTKPGYLYHKWQLP